MFSIFMFIVRAHLLYYSVFHWAKIPHIRLEENQTSVSALYSFRMNLAPQVKKNTELEDCNTDR